MKILLVQAMGYLYPWTGAHKANRILMEGLAARGHECRVITPSTSFEGYNEREYVQKRSANGEFDLLEWTEECMTVRKKGVEVHNITGQFAVFPYLKRVIADFKPDMTLVSDNQPHMLLEAVIETGTRSVFIAHSQSTLPFGPECFEESLSDIRLFRQLHGIISVSEYVRSYFEQYAGLESRVIYFPSYGPGPFPHLGRFDNPYITAINPSGIKGISIFTGLARRMPHLQFAAVPTWATSEAEIGEMQSIPNITLLKPAEDVNTIYRQTRIFLMPSLWGESFGQVVVEAMLRGIPVAASRVGGLPEAKLGLDYLLPVNPIREYFRDPSQGPGMPTPVIPQQDLEPWVEALTRLTEDREHYEELSSESYKQAAAFLDTIGISSFERYFGELMNTVVPGRSISERLEGLSAVQRERLIAALKERR